MALDLERQHRGQLHVHHNDTLRLARFQLPGLLGRGMDARTQASALAAIRLLDRGWGTVGPLRETGGGHYAAMVEAESAALIYPTP